MKIHLKKTLPSLLTNYLPEYEEKDHNIKINKKLDQTYEYIEFNIYNIVSINLIIHYYNDYTNI